MRTRKEKLKRIKKTKSRRQAKIVESAPTPIVKEQKPQSMYERFKDKVSRLWKRRQQELQKMKETNNFKKEEASEKTSEQEQNPQNSDKSK